MHFSWSFERGFPGNVNNGKGKRREGWMYEKSSDVAKGFGNHCCYISCLRETETETETETAEKSCYLAQEMEVPGWSYV